MRRVSITDVAHLTALVAGVLLLLLGAIILNERTHPAANEVAAAPLLAESQGLRIAPSTCVTNQWAAGLCVNPVSRAAILSAYPTGTLVGHTVHQRCRAFDGPCTPGNPRGSAVIVPPNTEITLEVDWLVNQYVGVPNGCSWFCGDGLDWYLFRMAHSCITNFGGTFTSVGAHRQATVRVTPAQSTIYELICTKPGSSGGSGGPRVFTLSVPVTVLSSVQSPTLSIVGNGTNPTTARVGDPVVIVGTYEAGPGDTLTASALNDGESMALPGVSAAPAAQKSYTFTPTARGTYTFYPAAQTQRYPAWNNYGAALTVTVNCPLNATPGAGNTCTCNPGFNLQANGTCTTDPVCSNGAINPPSCDNCGGFGYELNSSGMCVLTTSCSDPNAQPPACTTCRDGFSQVEGVCEQTPPTISSFTAIPDRVRSGNSTMLSWSVTHPPASCTITGSNGFSITLSGTQLPADGAQRSLATAVTANTNFTLRCGSVSQTLTVGIVPSYEEI